MKMVGIFLITLVMGNIAIAQSPVGKWKCLSYTSMYDGKPMDSQAALLSQRPCAAAIVYDVQASGNYRLDAAASGCDEKYKNIQEKLWSETKWILTGNKLNIYATSPEIGTIWTISFSGNKMTWKNEYDTIVYQKI